MADVSSSIETQKAYLKRYAYQNKYDNIQFYIDDGHSGVNFERPGFIALKEDIERNQIGIVITKDLSRLGRDYLTTGYYIEHYFPLHDIRYIAVNDQVDTDKSDNDFTPFRNIMNEWYARDISKKIRSAYKTKALNGDFTGPFPPYGYDRDPMDKHKLVVNQDKSAIVQRIFHLYLHGTSLYRISRILRQEKVLTPRAEQYRVFGAYVSDHVKKYPYDWSQQSILHILRNEEYTGKIICNKHQTSSYKSKKLIQNPKTDWIVSANKHIPIIDKDQFEQVKQLILTKKKMTVVQHENIFKSKLRCNECGKTLSLSIRLDKGGHRSFACSAYRRDTSKCTSHYIAYDDLKEFITGKINEMIQFSKVGRSKFINQLKETKAIEHKKNELTQSILRSTQRLSEVDDLTKKLFEKYVSDKITEDRFFDLSKLFDLEKIQLAKHVREFESKLNELNKEEQNMDAFFELISDHDETVDLQRNDVMKLIDKVLVDEKKSNFNKRIIKVYFRYIGAI